jgi:hypothetical protein
MKTDATKKIPGEGFKRAWPPLIKMDEAQTLQSFKPRRAEQPKSKRVQRAN